MNITLTTLEKKVLKEALDDGYIYDNFDREGNPDETGLFLTWGFANGKEERGASASLIKKGIVSCYKEGGDTYINLLISVPEAEELVKNI